MGSYGGCGVDEEEVVVIVEYGFEFCVGDVYGCICIL